MKIGTRASCAAGLVCLLLCFLSGALRASPPDPGGGSWSWPTNLNSWSFSDTNTWASDNGYVPISFTNLAPSKMGNVSGFSLVVDNTDPAWLRFNLVETNGATNLTLTTGTLMMAIAPGWASATTNQNGTGPGDWGRLLDVGTYSTNATGWWSLLIDSGGTNVYFGAQTNSGDAALTTYLSAPIDWASNDWHFVALSYSTSSNSGTALYIDGALAATGAVVSVYPGQDVTTNGFWIGSDSSGTAQVHGTIDDVYTYDSALDSTNIALLYGYFHGLYGINPYNLRTSLHSATSFPSFGPQFNAVTGNGNLTLVSTNGTNCFVSSDVWITNVIGWGTGSTMTVQFTIAGGSNNVPYDVFANSVLSLPESTNRWAWMGQGYHCTSYTLTNLFSATCFLILGTPADDDQDGLTTAYENLVSKTDPNNPDTDGDGVIDGWEIIYHFDPKNQDSDGDGFVDEYFGVRVRRPAANPRIP